MEFTEEKVAEIAKKLEALPAVQPPPRKLNKQEVVTSLRKEIEALRERGYTLEHIAEVLRGEGLDIGGTTLKSYLTRAKGRAKPKARPTSKKSAAVTKKEAVPKQAVEAKKPSGSFKIRPDQEDL